MFLTATLSGVLGILIIYYSWYRYNFNYWHNRKIPSVRGYFSGCLWDIVTMKTNFGYHLKTVHLDPKFQNEPVVGIYALHRPALLIRDPELIKSIFIKHFDNFRNHFARPDQQTDAIGCMTMFFSRDAYWRKMRTKFSPAFTGGKLRQMYPLLQAVGNNLEEHLQKKGHRFVMEMKQFSVLYTIDTINTTIFGIASNVLENPQDQLVHEIQRMASFKWKEAIQYILIFFVPQMAGAFKAKLFSKETENFLRTSINCVISDRERSGLKRNDLIDIFVKLKVEAEASGDDMSTFSDSTTALTWSFMFAGFDTTSTTLSNALLELAKNPEIQEKLRKEVTQAFRQNKGNVSYEILHSFEYLDMVVHETMRMYPPLPLLDRVHNTSDEGELFTLKPYHNCSLPSGMPVFISSYGLHYDSKHWPNPDVFDPERFSEENKQSRHPLAFLPFGNGPRNCVASRLGLLQVKIGLVYCLKNYYVQLGDQTNSNPEIDAKSTLLQIRGGINLEMVKDNKYNIEMEKMEDYF